MPEFDVKSVAVSLGLIIMIGSATTRAQVVGAPPRVTCEVDQGPGVAFRTGEPARIKSLQTIPLKVSFTGTADPRIEQAGSPSEVSTAASSVAIEVTMVGSTGDARVPIRTNMVGRGQDLEEHYVRIMLGVPIDDRERDAQSLQYIEWLASIADKQSPPVDPTLLSIYKNKDRWAVLAHAFDRVFFENKIGLFDVTCTYASKLPGLWNGEVRTAPVRINIVFEGHFFDQPQFRKQ
jgi:hypothetical protein